MVYQKDNNNKTKWKQTDREKKEHQAVLYIKKNLDYESPEKILQIYQQILEKDLFQTQEGLSFLEELKKYLIKKELLEEESREKEKNNSRKLLKIYQRRCKRLTVLCVMLILMIVGMMLVAATSNSPNILNYQEKIINHYAGWEQELTQREKELDQKEEVLLKKEKKQ